MSGLLGTVTKVVTLCTYAIIILLGVTFAVSNRGIIDLTFYPVPYLLSMPLYLFTIIVFMLGIFIGWSIAQLKTSAHKRGHKQATKRAQALENELGSLRTEQMITPAMALSQK